MKRFPPRKEFIAWLRAQPGGRVVGTRGHTCDCPITRWLRQYREFAAALWRTPMWVGRAMRSIDESGPIGTSVTARKVLQLIGEAP